MIDILFMIPNLGHGGAEKVLVNLVNHMDRSKYKITVMALYDEGVNRDSLADHIQYKACFRRSFPGVSHFLKLVSPERLYRRLVHEHYDIVVSYLEGQTARIVSGCTDLETKKMCWIHSTMTSMKDSARLFRAETEARRCYSSFDKIASVSNDVQNAFMNLYHLDDKGVVLYNTNETDKILAMAQEPVGAELFSKNEIKLCAMGSLIPVKGFDRLVIVHSKLREHGYTVHTYILGEGAEKKHLEELAREHNITESFTLLGYHTNPYRYLSMCDLFVCSSRSEGLSTAVTEALILGIPVVTTKVSGMVELLGKDEYGLITDNDENALYQGIRKLIEKPELLDFYRKQARVRGEFFRTENTVSAVEAVFEKAAGEIC